MIITLILTILITLIIIITLIAIIITPIPISIYVSIYLSIYVCIKYQGLSSTISRANENLKVLENFVNSNSWIHFLAQDKTIRSNTSVCLTLDLPQEKVKEMIQWLVRVCSSVFVYIEV